MGESVISLFVDSEVFFSRSFKATIVVLLAMAYLPFKVVARRTIED